MRTLWRELWPWIVAPPVLVTGAVLWLWLGAEGGFTSFGRYTLN